MSSKNDREMHNLPLLPLRGVVIFPGSVTTLDVGREKSMAAVEEAVKGDRRIFVAAQRDSMVDAPDIADLCHELWAERWANTKHPHHHGIFRE